MLNLSRRSSLKVTSEVTPKLESLYVSEESLFVIPTKEEQVTYIKAVKKLISRLPEKETTGDGKCPTAKLFKEAGVRVDSKCDLCLSFIALSDAVGEDAISCPCIQLGRKEAILRTKKAILAWDTGSHLWQRK